jgi:hypothetical protein
MPGQCPCGLRVGLQIFSCWNWAFDSRRWYGCLSLVSVVCCLVEVSASGWSVVLCLSDGEASAMRRPFKGFCAIKVYTVFTKEWCGFKYLLNDYILQLYCTPPFSHECTRATQSSSLTALDRRCCKWRQPHTHSIWDKFDYSVDVCRVTQGAHIEGLWLMH